MEPRGGNYIRCLEPPIPILPPYAIEAVAFHHGVVVPLVNAVSRVDPCALHLPSKLKFPQPVLPYAVLIARQEYLVSYPWRSHVCTSKRGCVSLYFLPLSVDPGCGLDCDLPDAGGVEEVVVGTLVTELVRDSDSWGGYDKRSEQEREGRGEGFAEASAEEGDR